MKHHLAILLTAAALTACDKPADPPPTVDATTIQGAPIDGSADAALNPTDTPDASGASGVSGGSPVYSGPAPDIEAWRINWVDPEEVASRPPASKFTGYQLVSFKELSGFIYNPPYQIKPQVRGVRAKTREDHALINPDVEETGLEDIPAHIKALSGKKVAVQGYMVTINFRRGTTNEFFLVNVIPDCFFCERSMPNQWVHVKSRDGKPLPYAGSDTCTVAGTLEVGAKIEDGYIVNLYRLEADDLKMP
ncbi:MAG: DUF3299 domain-containing protein [Planctomycetota bacterium]